MSKRLVVCCDGTWNTPDQLNGGVSAPTNVTKIAMQVAPTDSTGREQRVFYQRGVGTKRWERIGGGAFGVGLSRNVRDAYRLLVQNFEPGDELFFFGFSRGAFTARSTVGLIRNSGILRPEHADRVDEAYALYRDRSEGTRPDSIEAELFRRSYAHGPETPIHFIGVWDTVGALGIPFSGLPLVGLINRRWHFHDTDLSSSVEAAFQALAIDEKRKPFEPAIWTQPKHDDPEKAEKVKDQQLEQVWFAGVHCGVGGGYADPALSEIALLWMVDRARKCGLEFKADAFARLPSDYRASDCPCAEAWRRTGKYVAPDPRGFLEESLKHFYKLIKPFTRELGKIDKPHEHVASSANDRRKQMQNYRPPNLVMDALPEAVVQLPMPNGVLGRKPPRPHWLGRCPPSCPWQRARVLPGAANRA